MHGMTQVQVLVTEIVKGMAKEMLHSIDKVRKIASWLVIGVMTVSFSHQAEYVYGLFSPDPHSPQLWQYIQQGVAIIAAVVGPLVFDGLTLVCVMAISTKGLVKRARTMGLWILIMPVGMSGYINVESSGTAKLAIFYVLIVACIPATELIKSAMDPDYQAMDAIERKVRDALSDQKQTAETPVAPVVIDHDETDPFEMLASMDLKVAQAIAGYDAMTPEQRTGWTRKVTNASRRIAARRSEREAMAASLNA
jgi:hypothetical protein